MLLAYTDGSVVTFMPLHTSSDSRAPTALLILSLNGPNTAIVSCNARCCRYHHIDQHFPFQPLYIYVSSIGTAKGLSYLLPDVPCLVAFLIVTWL